MQEKFKEWSYHIEQCIDIARNSTDASLTEASEAADFLQRMADMPDDEPADFESISDLPCGRTRVVTKANRDWWIMHCGQFKNERDAANTKLVNAEHTAELLREHNRQLAIGINSSNELVINKNMELMAKDKELAAANARIKELEDSLCDKMTADNQAMGLYDQPQRRSRINQNE